MSRDRTERRRRERALRKLVRDREQLAALQLGGSPDHPIPVDAASVIEVRVRALRCPQCEGTYALRDHAAPAPGLRRVDVSCNQCGVGRALWFRLVVNEPN